MGKPGEHPDFFRFPAPEGRSRESTIVLNAEGQFFHEGARVEHPKLADAMHTWIRKHPDDGRYILSNEYDWTYFTVEDAPYFVRSLRVEPKQVMLRLSDTSEEPWIVEDSWEGAGDTLYTHVKRDRAGGPFVAKFTRHAQSQLSPVLVDGDAPRICIDGQMHAIPGPRPQGEKPW